MAKRPDLDGSIGWWVLARSIGRLGGAVSFSQEGEDRIIEDLIGEAEPGAFVDVGAFDPVRFSNTMRLYLRGWRGVNIEPNTAVARRFRRLRPGDAFVSVAVGETAGSSRYFEFDEPALNTLDESVAQQLVSEGKYRLVATSEVPVRPLTDVLSSGTPLGRFDLLSVDVEGLDEQVLESLDWTRFRPRIVCSEAKGSDRAHKMDSRMADRGYLLAAATARSRIYVDEQG